MELNKELVDYLANLSKIELSDKDSADMLTELTEIINYMEILKTLDTENAKELSHVFSITNVMRNGIVNDSSPREDILRNAPVSNGEAFVVPKAVE